MSENTPPDRLFLLCDNCGRHVRLDRLMSAKEIQSVSLVMRMLPSFKCSECGSKSIRIKEKPRAKPILQYAATEGTEDRVFHKSTCGWLKNTSLDREIRFSTREEAIKRGFRPCTSCRP